MARSTEQQHKTAQHNRVGGLIQLFDVLGWDGTQNIDQLKHALRVMSCPVPVTHRQHIFQQPINT